METIRFTIPLIPKGQKRDRSRGWIAKGAGRGGEDIALSQHYKEKGQRMEENKIIAFIKDHRPPEPLEGPLMLGVKIYLPIPKSKPKKWLAAVAAGGVRPIVTPDLDNCIKNLKDCAKGILWRDDKQVVGYLSGTGKYYSDEPRWEVEVRVWQPAMGGLVEAESLPRVSGGLFE